MITLPELSEKFNISEGHLCRFFKSMTRMSILEYTNAYRVSVSASLLRESSLDIGTVACMTGFNNISYFNKTIADHKDICRHYQHAARGRSDRFVFPASLLIKEEGNCRAHKP